MCSTELRSLVSSLEYLVSNRGQVLLEGIILGGSTTYPDQNLLAATHPFFFEAEFIAAGVETLCDLLRRVFFLTVTYDLLIIS